MRLQEIRLRGFKSFADPADLVIGSGITGIVGPNGCGKSNIVEAILWAMGESAPTSIRTSEMDQVIFAGGARRPARNTAEVSLIVAPRADPDEPAVPMNGGDRPANGEDIEITRRIARKSGSVYRINGREVRARDVHTLFGDAGGGARSCTIVRQNRAGELVNARPVDRRQLLEDAAGVSGLHQRRHEVELRINATVRNLETVDEQLASLDRQIAGLKRESRRVARYRKIAESLRHAEILLAFSRWRQASADEVRIAGELAAATTEAARALAASTSAGTAQQERNEGLLPLRGAQQEAAAALTRIENEEAGLASRIEAADRDARSHRNRIEQLRSDLKREQQLAADAVDTLARLSEAAEPDEDAGVLQTRLDEARAHAAAVQAPLAEAEKALDELNRASASLTAQRRQLEARRSDADAALDRAAGEFRSADSGIAAAQEERERADEAAAAAERVRESSRREVEEAAAAARSREESHARAERAERDARSALSEASRRLAALQAEYAALEGVLALPGGSGQPVLSRIKASPGVETALGALLGDWLQLPETDAATPASGWVRLDAPPDAAALPEEARPLSDLVEAPPALQARLRHTGLVESGRGGALQRSLRPGQTLVSETGEIWRWDGLHVAADEAGNEAARKVAARTRIGLLQTEIDAAEGLAEDAESALADRSLALESEAAASREARDALRRAEAATADRDHAVTRAQNRIERAEERLGGLRAARDKAVAAMRDVEGRIDALDDESANAPPADSLDDRIAEARAHVAGLRADALERSAEAERLRSALDTLERERERRRVERTRWDERRAAALERCGDVEKRIARAEADLQRASREGPALVERRRRLASLLDSARKEKDRTDDALAGAERALQSATREAREAESRLAAARETCARLEERATNAETRSGEAAAELRQAAGCEPEDAAERHGLETDSVAVPEDHERRIEAFRRERDRIGPVNLRVESDLQELEESRQGIGAERDDLTAALGKFDEAIRTINSEGRQRLRDAFDEVDRNFREMFESLFGAGASASLALIDSEDPFEAGVEIYAQPPGKRLLSLSQMSGGEKALTALALIFALFLTNPAPVCVLDEVDAPLDDANVQRFCDMLEEVAARTDTNFVVITHHAITISRMDRLYGVTMAEQGVSQLVSVDYGESSLRLIA